MITKEKAHKIAKEYLEYKNRKYIRLTPIEEVNYITDKKLLYGKYQDEIKTVCTVEYIVQWGLEEKGMLIYIDADSGEVLYSISPTSWIEELEEL